VGFSSVIYQHTSLEKDKSHREEMDVRVLLSTSSWCKAVVEFRRNSSRMSPWCEISDFFASSKALKEISKVINRGMLLLSKEAIRFSQSDCDIH
jgi:hypothetical protein